MALAAAAVVGALGATPALAADPGAPTGVTATAYDGLAIVSFVPPASDGGSAITAYTVTASPGGATASDIYSPVVIGGLSDGTAYTFTVTAVNADGTSVASAPSTAVTPSAPPSATGAPAISGSAVVDQTLQASNGSWSNATGAFAYQWFDCAAGSEDCSEIADATGSSYTVAPLDGGFELEVSVTATNADGEATTDFSTPTASVTALPGAPVIESPPTLSPVSGSQTVSATSGTWGGSPSGYSYLWYGCSPNGSSCHVVSGPSSQATSYTPTTNDAGDVLKVGVVAVNGTGHSLPAYSSPSGTITFAPPTVSISFPAPGADYDPASPVQNTDAVYACTPAPGETISSCVGSVASGAPIPFSFGGHAFTVTATDIDGETVSKTVDYAVGGAPTITVTNPGNGLTYAEGVTLPASAACTAFNGSALPCTLAQAPQPVCKANVALVGCPSSAGAAGPPALDTTTLGHHTFTVTTTDAYGESNTLTLSYTVVASPSATAAQAAEVTISRLAQSSSSWRIGSGTQFAFTPDKAAVLTFVFDRDLAGRHVGRHCEAQTPTNRRDPACTLEQSEGSIKRFEPAGSDVVPFSGRIGSSTLAAGEYSVTVSAVPIGVPSAHVSRGGTLKFTIVG